MTDSLSKEEKQRHHSRFQLFSKVWELRNSVSGVGEMGLPVFVLVGIQSSGKSSLIESFLNFPFNVVKGNVGTRAPLELLLNNDPTARVPVCTVNGEPVEYTNLWRAVEKYNSACESNGVGFSRSRIKVEVKFERCFSGIIIDTPGLVYGPGQEVVQEIVENEVRPRNRIIVCLLSSELDHNVQASKSFLDHLYTQKFSEEFRRPDWKSHTIFLATHFDQRMEMLKHGGAANEFLSYDGHFDRHPEEMPYYVSLKSDVIREACSYEQMQADTVSLVQRETMLIDAWKKRLAVGNEELAANQLRWQPFQDQLYSPFLGLEKAQAKMVRVWMERIDSMMASVLDHLMEQRSQLRTSVTAMEAELVTSSEINLRKGIHTYLTRLCERIGLYLDGDLEDMEKFGKSAVGETLAQETANFGKSVFYDPRVKWAVASEFESKMPTFDFSNTTTSFSTRAQSATTLSSKTHTPGGMPKWNANDVFEPPTSTGSAAAMEASPASSDFSWQGDTANKTNLESSKSFGWEAPTPPMNGVASGGGPTKFSWEDGSDTPTPTPKPAATTTGSIPASVPPPKNATQPPPQEGMDSGWFGLANADHAVYGGSQYARLLEYFSVLVQTAVFPEFDSASIASAMGELHDDHDFENYERAVVKMCQSAARKHLQPSVQWLAHRCAYLIFRLQDLATNALAESFPSMQHHKHFLAEVRQRMQAFVEQVMNECAAQAEATFMATVDTVIRDLPIAFQALAPHFPACRRAYRHEVDAAANGVSPPTSTSAPPKEDVPTNALARMIPNALVARTIPREMYSMMATKAQQSVSSSVNQCLEWLPSVRYRQLDKPNEQVLKQKAEEQFQGQKFLFLLLTKLTFNSVFFKRFRKSEFVNHMTSMAMEDGHFFTQMAAATTSRLMTELEDTKLKLLRIEEVIADIRADQVSWALDGHSSGTGVMQLTPNAK